MKAKERLYDAMIGGERAKVVSLQCSSHLMIFTAGYWDCLKRSLNASKPSEHPIKAFIRWEHRLAGQDLFIGSTV